MKPQYVLYVYRSASGEFSGRLFDGDDELCGVAGCQSFDEVKQAMLDVGQQVDSVVDGVPG